MYNLDFKIKFWAAVAIQIIIIFAVLFYFQASLSRGEKILLKLSPPRDPLSLFQGHYLILDYEISEIDKNIHNLSGLNSGEIIYVTLSDNGKCHSAASASLKEPDSGKFVRGRVNYQRRDGSLFVEYGIERYFIPESKALELDRNFRKMREEENIFVQISLAKSGRALIDKIFIGDEELDL